MQRYKSSDLAGLVSRLESTADAFERTKSRRDTHRAMVETPSPKRDPRCDVDRRDELVIAEKAVDVISLDLQRAAIAYVARLVRESGDPDTAAGQSLSGYLSSLEPESGLARELTADELDMLWRVELAERFTSPSTPSTLTMIERCNILETLTVWGLVHGNPHRLTIAGRVALERWMPNRTKIADHRQIRNIRTSAGRQATLLAVTERVIAGLTERHHVLPMTGEALALIGRALADEPELVGSDSISVTRAGAPYSGNAIRVRAFGVEVVRV